MHRRLGGSGTALILALASASVAGGLFLPLSLVYFSVLTDIPLTTLGVLVACAFVVTLPLPVVAGRLVDRVGARSVVTASLILQAVGYLGFAVVREPVGVLLATAVGACGSRLFWSSVFALVAEHADRDPGSTTAAWFARLNVIRTVGIVGGGLVAGVTISIDRPEVYVALAVAAAAGYAIGAILVPMSVRRGRRPSSDRERVGYRALLRDRGFLRLLALNAVFALATLFPGLSLPTLVRSGLGAPGWITSILLVANALLIAVLGRRGGDLAARGDPVRMLRRAGVLWVAAFSLVALGASLAGPWAIAALVVAILPLGLAEVLHAPASSVAVDTLAGPERRGRYLAVFQYSFVVAELVGPVLFTSLYARWAAAPFLAVAVLAAAAVVLLPRGPARVPSWSALPDERR